MWLFRAKDIVRAGGRPGKRPGLLAAAAAVIGAVVLGCTPSPEGVSWSPVPGHKQATSVTHAGSGDFLFDGPGRLAGYPIRVWYNAPAEDVRNAPILMVMTGAHRDGESYRSDWLPLVADHHVLLLVLEFSRDDYPGVSSYNLGRIVDPLGKPEPEESWTFNMVEALFDHVVGDVGSSATDYSLFGHSAGAQFVHRFTEFMPKSRARIAVAANAGWYTVLDDSISFPYGLKGSPLDESGLQYPFSRNLIVMLGADDVDPHDSSLQRDRRTDEQGDNRLARGLNFYQTARMAAGTSMKFNWQLIVVPGVAHSHQGMARAASPLLLGGPG